MKNKQKIYCDRKFSFGKIPSRVIIQDELPKAADIAKDRRCLIVCDGNTAPLAESVRNFTGFPVFALAGGEANKTWGQVETLLKKARETGLGRDGLFLAVGGGVVSDLAGFAASVYMRGAGLAIVSTSLLGMVDAALGGKTGFDFEGLKNFVGTFYPAEKVFAPLAALETLPAREFKSGFAELFKTAVISGDENFFALVNKFNFPASISSTTPKEIIAEAIAKAVETKGTIVAEDPEEKGARRALLNLGHTFGHALEGALGFDESAINHGEAVAWGLARSCALGVSIGVTEKGKAENILAVLDKAGFKTAAPWPGVSGQILLEKMRGDKKKKDGKLKFVVPGPGGAVIVSEDFSADFVKLVEKVCDGCNL